MLWSHLRGVISVVAVEGTVGGILSRSGLVDVLVDEVVGGLEVCGVEESLLLLLFFFV